jgi:prepilin-type N-terminal cleavage/methylation domain-containing protein
MIRKTQNGFTLLETMVSLAVLSIVAGIVMSGMIGMMKVQGTIANRTEMHTSVRSVTELLEQEVGQAGRISLAAPGTVVTMAAVNGTNNQAITLTPASANNNLFVGETLVVDAGDLQETVVVGGSDAAPTALFVNNHAAGAPVNVQGGFANGIVAPALTNGSSGTVLKLFGDLNNDGNMYYVEYTCDTTTGILYRQQLAYNAAPASKIATPSLAQERTMSLLTNILANPNDLNNNAVPCFSYQTQTASLTNGATTFVTDVAITLTEQTQFKDPQTQQYQQETKALLNVSPRNVVDSWRLASAKFYNRAQQMPDTVTALLPGD